MNKVTPIRPLEEADQIAGAVRRLEESLKSLDRKLAELSNKFALEREKLSPKSFDFASLMENVMRAIAAAVHMADLRKFVQAEEVDEFGRDQAFEEKIRPFFDFFFEKYWRVSVKGAENVPTDGSALFVANHSGTIPWDAMMIKLAIQKMKRSPRDIRFLVEDFVYHFPFLGTMMYRMGGVRACPENAIRLLEKGEAVLCFPEGVKGLGKPYSERYRLQRFGRGGFVRLCMKTGAPIIPVAVVGAEEIHPIIHRMGWFARAIGVPYIPITPTFPFLGLLGAVPLPTKWTIEFGAPMPMSAYEPTKQGDPILVNRVAEQVRQRIQTMIAEMLKKRISIFS